MTKEGKEIKIFSSRDAFLLFTICRTKRGKREGKDGVDERN